MQSQPTAPQTTTNLISHLLAFSLLLFSWFVCYLWVIGLTEGWGAPWDTTPIRPPLGHWQRTLNDFFESGIGVYLPTILFLLINIACFAHVLSRTHSWRPLVTLFATTNLLFFLACLLVTLPIQALWIKTPSHLTPDDWRYWGDFTREWPLTLIVLLLWIGLVVIQLRLPLYVEHFEEKYLNEQGNAHRQTVS